MLPEPVSHALTFATNFLASFEDDAQQEGVVEALKQLRRLPEVLQLLQEQARREALLEALAITDLFADRDDVLKAIHDLIGQQR